MFLPWLGVSEEDVTAAAGLGVVSGLPTRNGWESLTFLDVGLLVTALTAIGFGVQRLTAPSIAPSAASLVTAALGTVAAMVIGYRIVNPTDDASLEYGIWLSLIAAALIAYGGWRSFGDQLVGRRERAAASRQGSSLGS
jgi:Flp pilus assembly pilin Flp